jgi:predicted TIM-barrel fold metal-dependent hydrolase
MSADFPIVDAHQHFWDIDTNYHPWLRDEPPIALRYGDYRAIRRRYLPDDYFADAARLARGFPDTSIILNHTGLPGDRSASALAGWQRALATLATCPNATIKISGLGQPGQAWTVAANRGIVLKAIEAFGVGRTMFASNFPVDSLCATFDTIFSGFRTIVSDFSASEQRALFHDNAVRIYTME